MIVYKRFSQAILIEASGLVQIHWLNLLQTATTHTCCHSEEREQLYTNRQVKFPDGAIRRVLHKLSFSDSSTTPHSLCLWKQLNIIITDVWGCVDFTHKWR